MTAITVRYDDVDAREAPVRDEDLGAVQQMAAIHASGEGAEPRPGELLRVFGVRSGAGLRDARREERRNALRLVLAHEIGDLPDRARIERRGDASDGESAHPEEVGDADAMAGDELVGDERRSEVSSASSEDRGKAHREEPVLASLLEHVVWNVGRVLEHLAVDLERARCDDGLAKFDDSGVVSFELSEALRVPFHQKREIRIALEEGPLPERGAERAARRERGTLAAGVRHLGRDPTFSERAPR